MTLLNAGTDTPHSFHFLDNLDDGIVVKDREGHWLFANKTILQWYDIGQEDYIGKLNSEVTDKSGTCIQNRYPYFQSDERVWVDGQDSFINTSTDKWGNGQYLQVDKRIVSMNEEIGQILLVIVRDVTNLRRNEVQRVEIEAKFRTVFDYAGDAMFISYIQDVSNIRFTEVNNVACFQLGYSRDELLEMSPFDIVLQTEREAFYRNFTQRFLSDGFITIETVHETKTGEIIPVELSIRLLILYGERYAFTIARDISERKSYESLLYKKAYFDELTELPNNRWLTEQSSLADQVLDGNANQVAIMVINLDQFRQINDTYGREFGDAVLRAATERMLTLVKGTAELCRWNGEDWVALLTDPDDIHRVKDLGDNIIKALKDPYFIGNHTIFLSASIGLRVYPTHRGELQMSLDGLVRQASLVAHEARKSETGKMIEYSYDIESALSNKLDIADGLRYALVREELYLVYQPKWDSMKTIIGMEALVRWKHPKWGVISPVTFIPVAEEAGLISILGEYVLRKACEQLHIWNEKGYPNIRVAVNVSVTQLEQPTFLDKVKKIMEETQIDPTQIELEVTESIMMQSKQGLAMLHALHDYGVALAIDDFGTGYSSLRYLNQLPIHTLKIDQSFVGQLQKDNSDIVVTGIIQLAHNFGLAVVAEGVENETQLEILQARNCDAYQGYYFERPIEADEFEKRYLKPKYF
jgi:diguanylate cyclase (GGDEF)-like protein/PAS domain S-box-containing protein